MGSGGYGLPRRANASDFQRRVTVETLDRQMRQAAQMDVEGVTRLFHGVGAAGDGAAGDGAATGAGATEEEQTANHEPTTQPVSQPLTAESTEAVAEQPQEQPVAEPTEIQHVDATAAESMDSDSSSENDDDDDHTDAELPAPRQPTIGSRGQSRQSKSGVPRNLSQLLQRKASKDTAAVQTTGNNPPADNSTNPNTTVTKNEVKVETEQLHEDIATFVLLAKRLQLAYSAQEMRPRTSSQVSAGSTESQGTGTLTSTNDPSGAPSSATIPNSSGSFSSGNSGQVKLAKPRLFSWGYWNLIARGFQGMEDSNYVSTSYSRDLHASMAAIQEVYVLAGSLAAGFGLLLLEVTDLHDKGQAVLILFNVFVTLAFLGGIAAVLIACMNFMGICMTPATHIQLLIQTLGNFIIMPGSCLFLSLLSLAGAYCSNAISSPFSQVQIMILVLTITSFVLIVFICLHLTGRIVIIRDFVSTEELERQKKFKIPVPSVSGKSRRRPNVTDGSQDPFGTSKSTA